MKRIPALALTAALLFGTTAYATGGSASDPLVSLDHLNKTYKQEISAKVEEKIEASVSASYQRALAKLGIADGISYMATKQCTRGDTVTLREGTVFIFLAGTAGAKVSGGEVIDATTGAASAEVSLTEGHRYLVGEHATATVEVFSDAAIFCWEGSYSTNSAGVKDVTPFTDLVLTDWYYSYTYYAYLQGLFTGVSSTSFQPKSAVTRATLATVLYRLAGQPATSGESSFSDVPSGQWYSEPVTWAEKEDVVNGVGEGRYAPANNLTREQMAVMLYNYASKKMDYNVTASTNLDRFPDANAVSDWAVKAMTWAVDRGIISGRDTGMLDPAGTASRAEVSAMFQRFQEAYDKE